MNSIKDLYPHADVLKSILIEESSRFWKNETIFCTLLDKIAIDFNPTYFYKIESFKKDYFSDNKSFEINQIYKQFRKVKILFLNNKDTQRQLDIFKKTNIVEVEKLDWNKLNLSNFEEYVKNDYINFKVQRLWYFKIDCCLLSKLTLKNILEISPIELRISYLKFVSDSIKINKF